MLEMPAHFKNAEIRFNFELTSMLRNANCPNLNIDDLHFTAVGNFLIVETKKPVSSSIIESLNKFLFDDETTKIKVDSNSPLFDISYVSESCAELPVEMTKLSEKNNPRNKTHTNNEKKLERTPSKSLRRLPKLHSTSFLGKSDTTAINKQSSDHDKKYWRLICEFKEKENKLYLATITQWLFFFFLTEKKGHQGIKTADKQAKDIFTRKPKEPGERKFPFLLRNSNKPKDGRYEYFTFMFSLDEEIISLRMRFDINTNEFIFIDKRETILTFNYIDNKKNQRTFEPYIIDPKQEMSDVIIKEFVLWAQLAVNNYCEEHKITSAPLMAISDPTAEEVVFYQLRMHEGKYPDHVSTRQGSYGEDAKSTKRSPPSANRENPSHSDSISKLALPPPQRQTHSHHNGPTVISSDYVPVEYMPDGSLSQSAAQQLSGATHSHHNGPTVISSDYVPVEYMPDGSLNQSTAQQFSGATHSHHNSPTTVVLTDYTFLEEIPASSSCSTPPRNHSGVTHPPYHAGKNNQAFLANPNARPKPIAPDSSFDLKRNPLKK